MGFWLGLITQEIHVIYESRMNWTWHHSKIAFDEVHFYHRHRVVLLHLSSLCKAQQSAWGKHRSINLCTMLLWSHPFHSMLFRPLIPEICIFQNPRLKFWGMSNSKPGFYSLKQEQRWTLRKEEKKASTLIKLTCHWRHQIYISL